MLSEKINREMTEVGPGTPAGKFFRSYWLPVALPEQLVQRNPMPIEVLGEKLVLYRDGSGTLGLLDDRCAHRCTSLSAGSHDMKTAGRIDRDGVRCPYHGWKYGADGQCLDQPGEPKGSRFHEKIRIKAYQVRDEFGIIWAYLGEGEPPIIPPIDAMARMDGHRVNTIGEWPCNYLQVADNTVDPVHVSVLHQETDFDNEQFEAIPTLSAEPTSLGMKTIAGRPGYEREVEFIFPAGVRLALPIMDPSIMMMFWITPVDDTRTLSFHSWFIPLSEDMPEEEREKKIRRLNAFLYELDDSDPLRHATKINLQDKFAAASQGVISPRHLEHLGATDTGVILMRRLLRQSLRDVQEGQDPRGLVRDQTDDVIHFENVF